MIGHSNEANVSVGSSPVLVGAAQHAAAIACVRHIFTNVLQICAAQAAASPGQPLRLRGREAQVQPHLQDRRWLASGVGW